MKIKKIIYIVLGCIGVGLGAVGAVLPLACISVFTSCDGVLCEKF